MGGSETSGAGQRDVRLGQFAILVLFLQRPVVYVLRIVGVPIPNDVGAIPIDVASLALLLLSLAILVYLRLHVGRRWFFRLYPKWVSKWPHMRIVYVCFGGLVLWVLMGITVLGVNAAAYRLGFNELSVALILEIYVVGGKAKANRDRLRGEPRRGSRFQDRLPLPSPTEANLVAWGLCAALFLILFMALSCVTFLAPSSRDLSAAITWWSILAFVAVMFGMSLRNYRYLRRVIDL